MNTARWLLRCSFVVLVMAGLAGGCVSSSENAQEPDPSTRSASSAEDGLDLAPQRESVRTVQLYRGEDERSLPVTTLEGGTPLTLEFDLMAEQGRPLSIYFEHADRTWRRDLTAGQVFESYQDDRLLDYQASQGTVVPYVHYTYRLPNDDIRFRVSGNYVLRVTERGRPDSVLFERPFFVAEEAGALELGAEAVVVTGQQVPSVRPAAQYDPPSDLRGDPFGYSACFVRDGRLGAARCIDRPLLINQPRLTFELARDRAFAPTEADYTLDLSSLRAGRGIERTDRTASPIQVLLEPDYARFPDADLSTPLNGQTVIRAALRGRGTPALTAEYVSTTFAYVPPREQPLRGGVTVAGSFSGMRVAEGREMTWRADRGRYEGEVLLKQGQYQYFYEGGGPQAAAEMERNLSSRTSTYTTFIYYQDASLGSDRLLRVRSFRE